MKTKPRLVLTAEEIEKTRECLALLQEAQYVVDRAAQALYSVRGFADQWSDLSEPHETIKRHWHVVNARLSRLL